MQVVDETQAPKPDLSPLEQQALRLWPDGLPHARENRLKWLAGVYMARRSPLGWAGEPDRRKA